MNKYRELGKTTRWFVVKNILIKVFLDNYTILKNIPLPKTERTVKKLWNDPIIMLPHDTPDKIVNDIVNELNNWRQYNTKIINSVHDTNINVIFKEDKYV